MKKKFLILTLLIVPLLTACGSSNELKCTQERGVTTKKVIVKFDSKKEKATDVIMAYTFDFSKAEDLSEFGCNDFEECLKLAEEELEDCEKDSDFVSCKITDRTKSALTIEGVMNKEQIEKEIGDKKYDEVKKLLEETGLTCK